MKVKRDIEDPYVSEQAVPNDRSVVDLHPNATSQRRQLRTAGNPIGIMDQSEQFSFRRSMTRGSMSYQNGSFAPMTQQGLRIGADGRR